MFSNPDIAIEDLPALEDPDWQPMDPRFGTRILVQRLILIGFFVLALVALAMIPPIPLKPVAVNGVILLIVSVAMLVWPRISVPRRGYVLRDKDIIFRKGVIWRSVTAIPFNRIQHVETSSTPLDRKFELATLQIFTAGGSSGDLKIEGLNRDVAEKLRAYLLAKAGTSIELA